MMTKFSFLGELTL